MKYFSIDRIKQSSHHLENFHSGWVIVPFVLAANGVNKSSFTDLNAKNGTDSFLDKYFSGNLIGLSAGKTGNALRPRFKDVLSTLRRNPGAAEDSIINQNTKLWANAYSSRGYREMVNRGELDFDKASSYKLTEKFQLAFEENLPETFRFEELLVWLYAFQGIPNEINSWNDLFSKFEADVLGKGIKFAPEFSNRFKTNGTLIPWPNDFLSERPSNEVFQQELMPSLKSSNKLVGPQIPNTDPILEKVLFSIDNSGERNFLFYGPPGTGKTMYAHAIAAYLAEGDKERIAKIQFHPSLSYDDFIEGYTPQLPTKGNSGINYQLTDRHFVRLCVNAVKAPDKTFVIVIDELSRGDPSRVFGDILTYIDKDYRGQDFSLSYSGREFSIPDNVIIIGTTNPYDRSVVELDDALLRRFSMIEFPPSQEVLKEHFVKNGIEGSYLDRIMHLFSELNRLMPYGFGHAHFFRLEGIKQLVDEWNTKIRFLVRRTLQFDNDAMSEIDALFNNLFLTEKTETDKSSEDNIAKAAE